MVGKLHPKALPKGKVYRGEEHDDGRIGGYTRVELLEMDAAFRRAVIASLDGAAERPGPIRSPE